MKPELLNRRRFLAAGSALAALPAALHSAETRPAPAGIIDCQSHFMGAAKGDS